jgi:hypothetical protein
MDEFPKYLDGFFDIRKDPNLENGNEEAFYLLPILLPPIHYCKVPFQA